MKQAPIQMYKVVDKMTHFRNEQMLDAVEALEGKPVSRSEVMEFGKLYAYDNDELHFVWKGKLAIIFLPPSIDDLSMLNMEAILVYADDKVVKPV